ncbi:MAG: hypothetical protein HS111_07005 [Kofleriaceae bacterium]|nr:hypothetical protein [Kofleriaceae bacterium]
MHRRRVPWSVAAPGALLPALVTAAGCSILYDPDNLPPLTDAVEVDAAIDAPLDADPSRLVLTGVSPAELDEGVGAGGGRPALIVLEGSAIVGAAAVAVELVGSDEPVPLVGFDATADGTRGGLAVRVPVLPELAAGQTATLRITITQGETVDTVDVTVRGLDELRLTAATMNSADLAPRYSQIEVASNIRFTGAAPVRLRATAGVVVDQRVDGDAQGATPGPHGCPGGAVDNPGGCMAGGGRQGANGSVLGLGTGSGGGGGGFAAQGTAGSGMMPGQPGDVSGNDMLVPIESVAGTVGNRGGGGGGGGAHAAGGWPRRRRRRRHPARGRRRHRRRRERRAAGPRRRRCRQRRLGRRRLRSALLVRAGGAITAPGAWLSAPAGQGGTGNNAGGAGSVGRIRVDAAAGDVPSMATTPPAVRGPAWSPSVPSITTASSLAVELRGQPGRTFELRLDDQPAGTATPGVAGTAVPTVTLRPGRNQLCAVALAGQLLPESLACVDIFHAGP